MIMFTRLNSSPVAINPDLIERAEATPDTVITLVDDKKLLVTESLDEVIQLITDYRAYVIARARDLHVVEDTHPTLHVVPSDTLVAAPGHDHQPPDGTGRVIVHPGAAHDPEPG
jgi:flagellar protein FlbD